MINLNNLTGSTQPNWMLVHQVIQPENRLNQNQLVGQIVLTIT